MGIVGTGHPHHHARGFVPTSVLMPMTVPPSDPRDEIDRLEAQLDDAMRLFATFEEDLNSQLRGASEEGRAAIFARRAAYEQTLGIEALVERIFELRQQLRQ